MLLEAETNKYCPGGYDIGAISNLITWVLNFFLSVEQPEFCPKYPLIRLFRLPWNYVLLEILNPSSESS
jgi:hypothetical protein